MPVGRSRGVMSIALTAQYDILLAGAWHAITVRSVQTSVVVFGTLISLALLNLAAPKIQLVDHPDGRRKQHRQPVPLTGGIAILCGVFVGTLLPGNVNQSAEEMLALLAIVATIHAFDDQSGLSARQRLVIDFVIALAFVVITGEIIESLGSIDGQTIHLGLLATPLTILTYAALTNAYNMVDGLDGLAISQFLIALIAVGMFHIAFAPMSGFAPHAYSVFVASVVILFANLGLAGSFLRCFLGDSGARFLGFFLAYVLIMEGNRIVSPIGALFFVALPLTDMCAVIGARLRAGVGPMMPDRRHIHHLMVDAGVPPHKVVLLMAAMSIGYIGVFLLLHALDASDLVLAAAFIPLALLYWQNRLRLVAFARRALGKIDLVQAGE